MAQPEQLPRDHDIYPTERSRRSVLWRLKLRLQFSGWFVYLAPLPIAVVLLGVAALGWLIGGWQLLLFWLPLASGLLLLTATVVDVITVKWGMRPPSRYRAAGMTSTLLTSSVPGALATLSKAATLQSSIGPS
ncbi:hypothetical protein [Mycobacterium sp.]|uniref:hypothetical protein n=1 Tax=Mycobacterium sp. TaxID=1785 RepID=UPI003BAB7E32